MVSHNGSRSIYVGKSRLSSGGNLPRACWYVQGPVIFGDGVFHPVLDHSQYTLLDLEVFVL